MSVLYKGQTAYTLEEIRERAKLRNHERAQEIPTLLRQKESEYV